MRGPSRAGGMVATAVSRGAQPVEGAAPGDVILPTAQSYGSTADRAIQRANRRPIPVVHRVPSSTVRCCRS